MNEKKLSITPYTGDMDDLIGIIHHYATQDTFKTTWASGWSFRWVGPIFKGENSYMTNEGFPIDTTCWYVTIEWGFRVHICEPTFKEAVHRAHDEILKVLADHTYMPRTTKR